MLSNMKMSDKYAELKKPRNQYAFYWGNVAVEVPGLLSDREWIIKKRKEKLRDE